MAVLVLAVAGLVFVGPLAEPSAAVATIRVPADRVTIQGAVDAAGDGDTILVSAGTYPRSRPLHCRQPARIWCGFRHPV